MLFPHLLTPLFAAWLLIGQRQLWGRGLAADGGVG